MGGDQVISLDREFDFAVLQLLLADRLREEGERHVAVFEDAAPGHRVGGRPAVAPLPEELGELEDAPGLHGIHVPHGHEAAFGLDLHPQILKTHVQFVGQEFHLQTHTRLTVILAFHSKFNMQKVQIVYKKDLGVKILNDNACMFLKRTSDKRFAPRRACPHPKLTVATALLSGRLIVD